MSKHLLVVLCAVTMISIVAPQEAWADPAGNEWVVAVPAEVSFGESFAAKEIRRYIYLRSGKWLPLVEDAAASRNAIVVATSERAIAGNRGTGLGRQDYLLRSEGSTVYVIGGSDTATLYGAYRFAEHLGIRFYMDGDVVPDERVPFSIPQLDERRSPLFELRGIQPFHDFPEGPDWWSTDDYLAVIGQLPKMGMNFFGLHTYPENRPAAEPTVWIGTPEAANEDGSVETGYPVLYYTTGLESGWGFQAKKTSDYHFGAGMLYDRDYFGSEVMRGLEPRAESEEQAIELFRRVGAMFSRAFSWAHDLGVRTCVGTETPLVVPARVRQHMEIPNPAFKALGGKTVSYPSPENAKEQDPVYRSVRWDLQGYTFPVPNGRYQLTLRFCEVAHGSKGARVFDVFVEDRPVVESLDIFDRVGKDAPLDLVFESVEVADGALDIRFAPRTEYPCIAAIDVAGPETRVRVNCGGPAVGEYLADNDQATLRPEDYARLYEGIFTRIMRAYPIDYYWLWTPEGWTWSGVSEGEVTATLQDIQAAHDVATRLNVPFQLATCGWVLGPQYDRALFDRELPRDMAVSCINRAVGHDPVEPGFADIQDRGKWAIPWLEDDPALNSPQLWAGRMRRDAKDALEYGCNGLMGIHWRTRILSMNVSALAQAGWDQTGWTRLEPEVETGVLGGQTAEYAQAPIEGTEADPLYRTVRFGMQGYRLAMPDGPCKVTLQFCEPHYAEPGKRVFGVCIEGVSVVEDLDVFAQVGRNRALDMVFDTAVSDGMLNIDFVSKVEFPCIAAFQVESGTFLKKVNCGGEALEGYEKDLTSVSGHLPAGDFYQDWARAQFGPEVGEAAGRVFERMDGRLPRPSDWIGGPGGYAPSAKPWEEVLPTYAFVDEFAALRPKVVGMGNLERFDYWLSNFRFMRATARMCSVWHSLNKALDGIEAEKDPDRAAAMAREEALPLRRELVAVVSEAYRNLLAAVNTWGGLAGITNLEQHTFQALISDTGARLEKALGESLPADAQLARSYDGPTRLIVPTVRTAVMAGEPLEITAIVLSPKPVQRVEVFRRRLGQDVAFDAVTAAHHERGWYRATLEPDGEDFEYYVQAVDENGSEVRWPATAPGLCQTVVTVEAPNVVVANGGFQEAN